MYFDLFKKINKNLKNISNGKLDNKILKRSL